ncbi:MAG: hypothetical protein HOP13_11845 [Alphaproteobacteria bacterium]|nr:hypothetical protein [Alphaproteobacteria bacterium]
MRKARVVRRKAPLRARAGCPASDTILLFAKTRERLARLTDELRIALALVVVDELSYDEAAARLNIPMTALYARLAAAREAVRAMIADDERPRAVAAE